jgi:hypothetical protein
MPFLLEHFFSTCSILSSSLVLRQIVRVGGHDSHRRDPPLKRSQNYPQTGWQIFLAQVILFTQIDNDLRNSGKFVHHYLALLFILLHFLETTLLLECGQKNLGITRTSRMVSA